VACYGVKLTFIIIIIIIIIIKILSQDQSRVRMRAVLNRVMSLGAPKILWTSSDVFQGLLSSISSVNVC
jgi:hypothetical protein